MVTSPQVIGIGEAGLDFIASEPVPLIDASTFVKCFGGAPMNTAVGVSRLGVSSGAITAVGDDPFGEYIINELRKNRVDTSRIVIKHGIRTTIAFVINQPITGEKTSFFYRKPWVGQTADSALEPNDIDFEYISKAKILHVSGHSLSQNPARKAIVSAVKYAKENGVRISFDPTLRLDCWNSEATIKRMYTQMLRIADIATFSEEESKFMFETNDPRKVAEKALEFGVNIVGVKLGSKGSFIKSKEGSEIFVPAFKVNVIDTTGAGDGWDAGLLVSLLRGLELKECATIANAVGALVVTKRGAITALPYKDELNQFLMHHGIKLKI